MRNLSQNQLIALATKKAGRERMNAILELGRRYEERTGCIFDSMACLDLTEPKAY